MIATVQMNTNLNNIKVIERVFLNFNNAFVIKSNRSAVSNLMLSHSMLHSFYTEHSNMSILANNGAHIRDCHLSKDK